MQEITPGIVHWQAYHEGIRARVSSYMVVAGGTVLDPMRPDEGFDALAEQFGEPKVVVLTNRHHFRHSAELQEAYGVTVHCHELGMHAFNDRQQVQPFAFGDELPGGSIAQEVGALTPEETAVWFPDERSLAFADGVVRMPPDGTPGFVPDELMGSDPEKVKRGLREACQRLARLAPENLLLAHGLPFVGGGREALVEVAAG
jgi:glyoxylase-like metal-dependent hydrolase (beta-lactamase superfamily II)